MGVKERITKPLGYKSGAVLISIVLVLLVIPALGYERAWAFASGLRWTDYQVLNSLLGEGYVTNPDNVLWSALTGRGMERSLPVAVSLAGFIFGGFIAAVISKEFGIRIDKSVLPESIVGGLLMGIGIVFISTCNIGTFINALPQLNIGGYLAGIGLVVGTYIGAKYYEKRMGF
jgi:hypothetical protein